jgi:antitoxin ParD1/3/4
MTNNTKTLELPDDVRIYVEKLVESGRFESPEAVISTAVENMRLEDSRIEQWLHDEVMPTYLAMKADPSRGIPAEEVFAEIKAGLEARKQKSA